MCTRIHTKHASCSCTRVASGAESLSVEIGAGVCEGSPLIFELRHALPVKATAMVGAEAVAPPPLFAGQRFLASFPQALGHGWPLPSLSFHKVFRAADVHACSSSFSALLGLNACPSTTCAILHARLVWAVPSLAASCALAAALAASRTSQKKKCVPSPRQSAHSGAGRAVQHNRRNGRNSQLILVSIHFFRCQVLGACKKKEFLRVSHREK